MDTTGNADLISLNLAFDLDSLGNKLEREWREAFEANLMARAAYHALTANRSSDLDSLDRARECLERSEALKCHVMNKIDQLEFLLHRRIARRA
jgi:hypothetical protein